MNSTSPSHIRLVESHARLAGAVRMLASVIEGRISEEQGLTATRALIAQSEEWMAASDERVRGVCG